MSWFILVPKCVQSLKKGHQIIFIGFISMQENPTIYAYVPSILYPELVITKGGEDSWNEKRAFQVLVHQKYIFIMQHYLTCFGDGGQQCEAENVQAFIPHLLLSAISGGTQQDSQWRFLQFCSVWMFKHIECKNAIWGYKCLRHKAAADCSRRTFINIFNLQFISHLVIEQRVYYIAFRTNYTRGASHFLK